MSCIARGSVYICSIRVVGAYICWIFFDRKTIFAILSFNQVASVVNFFLSLILETRKMKLLLAFFLYWQSSNFCYNNQKLHTLYRISWLFVLLLLEIVAFFRAWIGYCNSSLVYKSLGKHVKSIELLTEVAEVERINWLSYSITYYNLVLSAINSRVLCMVCETLQRSKLFLLCASYLCYVKFYFHYIFYI